MATDNIASSVMQTLGGGSGIDIVKLARDLTDVEKLPAEDKINASKNALLVSRFNTVLSFPMLVAMTVQQNPFI